MTKDQLTLGVATLVAKAAPPQFVDAASIDRLMPLVKDCLADVEAPGDVDLHSLALAVCLMNISRLGAEIEGFCGDDTESPDNADILIVFQSYLLKHIPPHSFVAGTK